MQYVFMHKYCGSFILNISPEGKQDMDLFLFADEEFLANSCLSSHQPHVEQHAVALRWLMQKAWIVMIPVKCCLDVDLSDDNNDFSSQL